MPEPFFATDPTQHPPRDAAEGLERAAAVLRRALEPSDDDAELFLHDAYEATANLVPSSGHLALGSGGSLGAGARVWRDGRCGFAARAVGDGDDLARLVVEAREDVRRRGMPAGPVPEAEPDPPGPPPGVTLSVEGAGDDAWRVARALAGAGARVQTALVRDYLWWTGVVNTRGVHAGGWLQQRNAMARCETPAGAVVDAVSQPVLAKPLDVEPLHDRIAGAVDALAAPGGDPDPTLPVVLRPAAAAPLVGGLAWFLRATTALEMRGVRERLGRRLFPPALTVVDDPHAPGGAHDRVSDDEGLPTRLLTCVRQGRLEHLLHSSATAAAFGTAPTGHGTRMGVTALPAPMGVNLHVLPGRLTLPEERLEIVARIETLTSMPRPGLLTLILAGWEVRGDRRRRIGPFDLDVPLLQAWRRLRGVGDDLQFLPVAEWCGTPTLVFDPLMAAAVAA